MTAQASQGRQRQPSLAARSIREALFNSTVSDTGPTRGMRYEEAHILKVCEWQGCRPTTAVAPSHGLMKLNELDGEIVERNL